MMPDAMLQVITNTVFGLMINTMVITQDPSGVTVVCVDNPAIPGETVCQEINQKNMCYQYSSVINDERNKPIRVSAPR